MKKLFTLALVFLVTFAVYSQEKSASVKNDMRKAATMKKAGRMETVNANVQCQPNMLRFDYGEGELDYTTYDWQTNAGFINRTIVWPDDKVNFAYTMATTGNYSDRGTGIGTYDYNNDEWIPSGGRIESEKTGFGSIARYKENGIVIAAHTDTECGLYILEDRDDLVPNSIPCALRFDPTIDPAWPVVMTSGSNRDIIHVIATGYSNNNLYYFRSSDGQSWDRENVVLPFLTEEYGSDWGSNVAYWMETTEDNCLAYVVNNAWSDCMVCYSYDDGETWQRKVFWHHPGINTTFNGWFMYPRWASCVWGVDGELCVAYELNGCTGAPGSGNYDPAFGAVAFWGENMPYHGDGSSLPFGPDPTNPLPPVQGQPFIMDSAYVYNDIWASSWFLSNFTHEMWPEYMGYLPENAPIGELGMHGDYNCGCVAMPVLCKLPNNDAGLVAVWSAISGDQTDESGNYFFKLFASCSGDGGRTWKPQVELVQGFLYAFSEFVYTQAAVIDQTLILAVQTDNSTGTSVMGGDNDPDDNFYQGFTFDLNNLFPNGPFDMPEVEHNTRIILYPNPTVDRLNITLNKNTTVTVFNIMGQAVMDVEGHAGVNTLDISNLGSGVYFVRTGNDTQRFVVK